MKILDCTLRDGGYYTNWDFDSDIVNNYIRSLNALPIDYIELGYRNKTQNNYVGEYGYCPLSTLNHIRSISNKRIAIMLNEKDTSSADLDYLLQPIVGIVDMVRIAVDPQNFDRAIELANSIKYMGFEVAFNMMYMSTWDSIEDFYPKLYKLNNVVDLFCMVDSYGSVTPDMMKDTIMKVRKTIKCNLGFHGHDNLSLGLANAIIAIGNGVDIVDSTILGMGRGAGNLKTELLLAYLNKYEGYEVNFNVLNRIVESFVPLLELHKWGTNLPYMLSGANSIPQKKIMSWIQNRVYSFNSIIRALSNRKDGVKDNAKYPIFTIPKSNKNVVIIGGGTSVKLHLSSIKTFIRKYDASLIFATSRYAELFNDVQCEKFYILVGNEGERLSSKIINNTFKDICILPPYPREMGTDVPTIVSTSTYELENNSFMNFFIDSCTTISLQLATLMTCEKIFLVGYDGYVGGNLTEKEITLNKENAEIFKAFKEKFPYQLISLLPTHYSDLKVESIYTII